MNFQKKRKKTLFAGAGYKGTQLKGIGRGLNSSLTVAVTFIYIRRSIFIEIGVGV